MYSVHSFSSNGGRSHLEAFAGQRAPLLDAWPVLTHRPTGLPVESAMDYLLYRFGDPKMLGDGTWSADTVNAAAFDLRQVFEVASEVDIGPLEIDGEFLDHYRSAARQTVNARGKLNSPDYVNRQVRTAFDFALFAHDRGYRTEDPGELDLQAVGVSAPEAAERTSNNLLRRPPRAMLPHEIAQLVPHLGKLPSERRPGDGSARLRLGDQFAKVIGTRADETVSIVVERIRAMRQRVMTDPGGSTPLLLDKTKGLNERHVPLPHWLAREALVFDETERADALAMARRHWLGDGPEPVQLFLNGAGARADAGSPWARERLESEFHNACLAAGLLRDDRRLDGDLRPTLVKVAAFGFHSGRHTHAVQCWIREQMKGNRHPEVVVQARLGHLDPQTTRTRYLPTVGMFLSTVGDGLDNFFRMLNNGTAPR